MGRVCQYVLALNLVLLLVKMIHLVLKWKYVSTTTGHGEERHVAVRSMQHGVHDQHGSLTSVAGTKHALDLLPRESAFCKAEIAKLPLSCTLVNTALCQTGRSLWVNLMCIYLDMVAV